MPRAVRASGRVAGAGTGAGRAITTSSMLNRNAPHGAQLERISALPKLAESSISPRKKTLPSGSAKAISSAVTSAAVTIPVPRVMSPSNSGSFEMKYMPSARAGISAAPFRR